jgi:hypothetical protein
MITQERLKELLHYDPETGLFTNLTSRSNCKVGQLAGSKRKDGCVTISIIGRVFYAQRLAWLYIYGSFPKQGIEYINKIKGDDRIHNLRDTGVEKDLRLKSGLTQNRLKELLVYNPETGIFTNRVDRSNRKAGKVAGVVTRKGYIAIKIDRKSYQAHRLAWLYVFGSWPTDQLDHLLGDKADNRLASLRPATNQENQQNVCKGRNNSSGHIGVSLHKRTKKWQASLGHGRKSIYLGIFNTSEEAHQAYLNAKAIHHTFNPIPREASYASI